MLQFVETDPAVIFAEMVATYEEITETKLYDGQPEMLFLRTMSLRESLYRLALNRAANRNLVRYADGLHLDELGALVDTSRLPAEKARALVHIEPVAPMTLPAGTVIQSKGTKLQFATLEAALLPADVWLEALAAGADANGLDDITTLISSVSGIRSITVLQPASGGAEEETDDRYRERIQESPEHFSVAGPVGAYRYFAMSASALVLDVDVLSSEPGVVDVYVLAESDVLARVEAALSADDVRPLTDRVLVHPAVDRPYSLGITYKLYNTADRELAEAAILKILTDYAAALTQELGKDVVRSQIIGLIMPHVFRDSEGSTQVGGVEGVYSVSVDEPAVDVLVASNEVPRITGAPVVIYGGMEEG